MQAVVRDSTAAVHHLHRGDMVEAGICICVCVCVKERKSERVFGCVDVFVCVWCGRCVCGCERVHVKEKQRLVRVCVCMKEIVCVCVCVTFISHLI